MNINRITFEYKFFPQKQDIGLVGSILRMLILKISPHDQALFQRTIQEETGDGNV